MRHKCFPTFDYELYLGPETGTVENCLIKPIEALLSVFDKYGAKGTFFVDCAYLYKLNELRQKHTSLQQDYDMVSENLKMLAANGHEIQMHFHPQWLYSDYVNGKWKLDFEHYKLSDVEPDYLEKSFGESRKMLESIIGKEICAYRAGGYCLSDYDDFVRLFRDNHISIDSSVVPGSSLSDGSVEYDYTITPRKPMWRFSDKITEEVPDGEFTEKAVSTIKEYQIVYFINKFKERFGRHKHSQRWGDGKSIYERVPLKQRLLRRVKNIFGSSISVCSFDGASSMNLEKYLKRCNGYLLMVSHPKCLTTQGLKDLDAFISRHKNDLDFKVVSRI